jgi:ureidoglycolate lyase
MADHTPEPVTKPVPADDLRLEALTDAAFAAFGEVIATHGREAEAINYGRTRKFADLAQLDVAEAGGRPAVHIYRSTPVELPLRVGFMERHPLASQAFIPLHPRPFVVIVAPPGDTPRRDAIRAFLTDGAQGVNLTRGVWHHHQVTLREPSDYLVIDRAGPGENFEERRIEPPLLLRALGPGLGK